MKDLNPKHLVAFLKQQSTNVSFIDKLKITYRPYICPFHDLLKEINSDNNVFDIGCGSGQFALLAAEFVGPKAIAGIEISEELIENAEELLTQYSESIEIAFQKYNGDILPDSIQSYDRIFMIDVLHHIPKNKQVSFLQHLYDSIVPGTHVILKDINKAHVFSPFNKIHDLVVTGEIGNEVSAKRLGGILGKIGFTITSFQKKTMLLYPHYTFVLIKD